MTQLSRPNWSGLTATLRSVVVCLLLPLLVATCGEDGPSGPSGPPVVGRVEFTSGPLLSGGFFGPNLPIDRVHVVIQRPPGGDLVKDTTRSFDPNQNQLRLDLPILLRAAAESLDVTLELLSGTTVLFSGTSRLEARAGPPSDTPPPAIPLIYSGPGSQIAQLLVAPLDSTLDQGDSLIMRVAGLDGSQVPVPAFYVGWSSSDTTIARVNGAGVVRGRVPRGTVFIRARTPDTQLFPTGIIESTTVTLVPDPASLIKVGGDNQAGAVGTALPQPLEVEVRAADGLPIAGIQVAFATTVAGASVDSAAATTDANGVARSGAVLGSALGPQSFTASVTGLSSVTFTATATSAPTPTWTGAVSFDWNNAGNWNTGAVPGGADSVTIPAGTPNSPDLTSNVSIAALLNNNVLNMVNFSLTLDGNLRGSGSISGNSGSSLFVSAPATIIDHAAVTNLVVSGTSVALARNLTVSGNLTVQGSTANLDLNGHSVTVSSDFATQGGGTLTMTNVLDTLRVLDDVVFNGGSTAGKISSGAIIVVGDFTQQATTSGQSYAPTGNHIDIFAGAGIQTITFATPGATSSNFETLGLANSTGGVTLASDVFLAGPVGFATGVPRIAHGTGQTLFVAELQASNVTLDNLLVAANNVLLTQFDSITFINYSPTATPLTISHPGSATPFVMNDLSFGVTPTSGFYISATDLVADANVLTLNLVNPTPGASGGFVRTQGGAVVNWPFVPAGARTWTGAIDNDWFKPGNWSPASLPTGSDDVIIPNTSIHPVLAGAASVRDLTVQAGVVLTLNADLTVTGSASLQSTTIGTGSIVMVTHGAGVQGTLRNLKINLATRFESIFVTGNVIASGVVEVQRGHLDVGANTVTTNTFVTSGEGMLKMTQAAGTLIVSGNADFGGEDPTGVLIAGTIRLRGNFAQLTGITQGSFVATGTNRVILDGTGPQVVTFTSPAGNGSRFQDLEIANTSDTVFMTSNVFVGGQLIKQVAGSAVIGGAAQLFTTSGAAISGLEFLNTPLALLNGSVAQFDNVTWSGFAPFATQLTVARPAGTLSFSNHVFTTTPSTGFYLRADDTNPSDGQPLTINMVAPTPATPGGFVQTAGGAVVNWPTAPGGTVIWTGAVSSDWSLPGNWSTNAVPTFADSVDIPGGGNQPVLTAQSFAGALRLASGTLTINGQILGVLGNFYSVGSARLVMTNVADFVSIGGDALFDGADQLGFMSAGNLVLGGDLTQQNSTSLDSYHPSGTHTTLFNGTTTQTVRFLTPGLVPGSSHLQEVIWAGNADLVFSSDVYAHGTFTALASTARTISSGAGALKLTTGGWSSGLGVTTLSNIQLVINQATPTILNVNNLTFVNQPTDVIQLQVGHPGSGGAFSFNNLSFSVVPTTGFYLSALDLNAGDGLPFTIDMVNPTPATPGTFVQAIGSVVNWPASGGGSAVWTGASNNQVWDDAGNWAGNVVPSPGADVLIPASASSFPALVASHQVNNLVVEPGATVFFGGGGQGFLEVTGDLTGGGSMIGGGPTMSGMGRTIEMADVGGTLRITGSISLGANLIVSAGDLQIQGTSANFNVNGFTLDLFNTLNISSGGTLQMTDPAGAVNVQGHALFDGGSETGLLTAGVLTVLTDFIQGSSTSNTSFAASGSHVTILGRPSSLRAVLFATPGSGTNGSHFNALDVSAATGGLGLGSNIFVDSALISTTASASLQGFGFSVTSRRWSVSGLTVNNAPMILDEQSVAASETFSNVTFSGFPVSGTTMMTVSGPGNDFAARPAVTTTNVNFQSLGIGAGNLYVKLTSTNGQAFTMNMTGSNQSPQVAGNGPALSDPANQQTISGARINWP